MHVNIPSPPGKSSPILILGAGTWGTSIAYQLAKRGYKCVKVLDCNVFPSAIAAGNDSNKILNEGMIALGMTIKRDG
jgi:sarcosine oxidase/L-pipecolate oxidase